MSTKKYHPEYDTTDRYLAAAQQEQNSQNKLLLEQAAATISHLKKHFLGTRKLLAEMNNEIVESLEDDSLFFDATNMEVYLRRIQSAIETCDDSKNEFSIPFDKWSHLTVDL